MTLPPELEGSADRLRDGVQAGQQGLRQPFERRRVWAKRRKGIGRRSRKLKLLVPVVTQRYSAAMGKLNAVKSQIRKDARRQKFGLWFRIAIAAIVALLRRFGWYFLAVVVLATMGLAAWTYLPKIIAKMEESRTQQGSSAPAGTIPTPPKPESQ